MTFLQKKKLIPTGIFSEQVPNSVASMSNFLLLQSQNKLDSSPLSSPVHASLLNNSNLNTAQLYSSSPTTIVVASNANSTAGLLHGSILNQAQTMNHTGLLNNSNTSSLHSAHGALNFAQQATTSPLSLTSTASSSLAITAPLHSISTNQPPATIHQTPFVHLSQLNQQQQQYSTTSNFYYSTLQPANRRVRVISNNLNGLTTIDDLNMHMHTDV